MNLPTSPVEPHQTVAKRLRDAHAAYKDAQEVADRTGKVRRELVLEAVDAGMSYKAVGEIIEVGVSRVLGIVGQAARGG
jgi:hypothetical protein